MMVSPEQFIRFSLAPGRELIAMIHSLLDEISPWATIVGFLVGLPAIAATYFQAFKARQEAQKEREGTLHSANCLEFIAGDGTCINLVPLESLHSLPKPGDVVLLPAHGVGGGGEFLPGAYLVESIEHIYAHVEYEGSRPNEARLAKMVAQVTSLNPTLPAVSESHPVRLAAAGEKTGARR